jgi:hypothetical protein
MNKSIIVCRFMLGAVWLGNSSVFNCRRYKVKVGPDWGTKDEVGFCGFRSLPYIIGKSEEGSYEAAEMWVLPFRA